VGKSGLLRLKNNKKVHFMFRGAHSVSLDSKGRLAIPTKYRAMLHADNEGHMVCTVDLQQRCLLLYSLSEWQVIEARLLKLSNMNASERRVQRVLLGNAMDCQIDKNGRILLSSPLREHAGLSKKIMLVGQLNKFELWDEHTWHEQMKLDIEQEQAGDFELSDGLKDFSF